MNQPFLYFRGPFGSSEKDRRVSISIAAGNAYFAFCSFILGKDGSLYFCFRNDFKVEETGTAVQEGTQWAFSADPSTISLPDEALVHTHLSLHSSGACHLRRPRYPKVFAFPLAEWFPVTKGFTWFRFFTPAVSTMPIEKRRPRAHEVVQIPSAQDGLELTCDIIARLQNCTIGDLDSSSSDFWGKSPFYAVRARIRQSFPNTAPLLLVAKSTTSFPWSR